ncbi:hypothetical protein COY25_04440 [Candidatus Uhrbacteria bacterium CG_4_10_14_0_2_um_filter_41_7]|uniref:Glycosyltransferase 2-like domain-containing protein n=1 Tax=Candidatus Uhrbacteria bacterium CG_4_9_14_3_um_filter_41_35 TaxID=1975034 RepID=A0A2M7XD68_9BACT|nr:MAG: hypothetical protein COV92_01965 [Candidatus Uhrbacteria bacterium CG11_big_fil_rev_8_21_14_0_20_41_9]PIZ52907.1 MAG: hypothetical protein COY25_04440 [Candidatus Uhrbacteria bacterium CG_4_10_14_0_2_um_filter_41_7]PJA45827.1 MAG: hypothetical protein CO173_04630 [Candidatus Uhrbacteria bacterium CG_4_9_14_3_um_filter_41_35]
MSEIVDVSIIIVHTFEKEQIRQTLKSIGRAAPKVNYEIIVVDNNPAAGMYDVLKSDFTHVRYIANDQNKGFGGAMNEGINIAKGRYIFIFNPDIVVGAGSIEELVRFMDDNKEVGVCGPQLRNSDGSLQYSCYRLPGLSLPMYRRTPLGKTKRGKEIVDHYLMVNDDHSQDMEVDAMIGAAIFTRREALFDVGMFDERFFLYYEDNDLCRRFWEKGYKVVYHPGAVMTHYHRRASADGGLFKQLTSKMTWIHISSFFKYQKKYKGQENPRLKKIK